MNINKNKITVLLIDDFKLFGDVLHTCFEDSARIKFLGACMNDDKVCDICIDLMPDIVLIDVSVNNETGLRQAKNIAVKNQQIKIAGFSINYNQRLIDELFSIGAKGLISKNCSLERITDAIVKLSLGEKVVVY